MAESSAAYIHLVHHLIEECIVFKMSKEECMEALSKHADISPVVTSTVWKELEKVNREFFQEYTKGREQQAKSEAETRQVIQKLLFISSAVAEDTTQD